MSARSVFILLRIPFSFFLLPIALFGLLNAGELDPLRTVLIMVAIHIFLYPASNGFNSYYDKDESPIGGIAAPPLPTKGLLRASLIFDAVAVLAGIAVNPWFGAGLFVYGLFSKAYSWDRIRWKRRPVFSLLGIALVQGGLTFLLVAFSAGTDPVLPGSWWQVPGTTDMESGFSAPLSASFSERFFAPAPWVGALVTSLFLMGVYPLTQVYQHKEDERRGDLTYSRLVGIHGTFVSSAIFFVLTALGFAAWFLMTRPLADVAIDLLIFALCLAPSMVYFFIWWRAVVRSAENADFGWTMRMNSLASTGMNLFLVVTLLRG